MILELKIRNFLSFKDETTFSFEATADSTLEDYYVSEVAPGVRILKMAMVYGANASGKSNLLSAFDFIKRIIKSRPKDKDEETGFLPFLLDEKTDVPGSFELTFYIGDKKYKYFLELDSKKIYKEKLIYYPGTRPAIIFDRYLNIENQTSIIEYGSKLKISDQAKEEISLKTLKNSSVFAAYKQVNIDLPELEKANRWFSEQFMSVISPDVSLKKYSDSQIKSNETLKSKVLSFIKEADFNISYISFEDNIQEIDDETVKMIENLPLPNEKKSKIINEKAIHLEKTVFEHKIVKDGVVKGFNLNEDLQSMGTMRFYGLSAPLFNCLETDAFLAIDEISTSLHPLLVTFFIKEFLDNSKQAQLIFTSHNLSLLMEKDLLRKDAIWFTEKGADGGTSLFSLTEFNIRKELSFYNAYKQGKFGAIPRLED